MGGSQNSSQGPKWVHCQWNAHWTNNNLYQAKQDNMLNWEIPENYAKRGLCAKYEQVDINKVGANQRQLNNNQHHDWQSAFAKYNKLFDGSLGVYPDQKAQLI